MESEIFKPSHCLAAEIYPNFPKTGMYIVNNLVFKYSPSLNVLAPVYPAWHQSPQSPKGRSERSPKGSLGIRSTFNPQKISHLSYRVFTKLEIRSYSPV